MANEVPVTVVCHGDGDGLISAAAAIRYYGGSLERLVITQPFLLDKIGQIEGPVVVLDIAVNNRDPEMTRRFAEAHEIVAWWDHHQGYELLVEWLGEAARVGEAPSCPQLMLDQGIEVPAGWVEAANACDRPAEYPPTFLSRLINQAIKVALVEQTEEGHKGFLSQIQTSIVGLLTTWRDEYGRVVVPTAQRYELLEAAKAAVVSRLTEVCPGVVCALLREDELVDKTAVFMEGYKVAPVVVLQFVSRETQEPVTTIATSRKDLNLVSAFGLPSGAPFRVTIVGGDHQSQLERVKNALAGKVA